MQRASEDDFAGRLAAAVGRDRDRGSVTVAVDRARALRYLGYVDQPMDAALQERFLAHARDCEGGLRATYCWQLFPVNLTMDHGLPAASVAEGALLLPGASICRHLKGAEAVVLMAVTLGFDCERKIAQLGASSPTDQLLYSTCASALVEAAADLAQERVDALLAPAGCHTGPQYAPGYGDLPVSVQPRFLETLGAGRLLGVTATEGNVLVPVKSITACMGVFPLTVEPPDERVNSIPCDNCTNRNSCTLRKKGRTCYGR